MVKKFKSFKIFLKTLISYYDGVVSIDKVGQLEFKESYGVCIREDLNCTEDLKKYNETFGKSYRHGFEIPSSGIYSVENVILDPIEGFLLRENRIIDASGFSDIRTIGRLGRFRFPKIYRKMSDQNLVYLGHTEGNVFNYYHNIIDYFSRIFVLKEANLFESFVLILPKKLKNSTYTGIIEYLVEKYFFKVSINFTSNLYQYKIGKLYYVCPVTLDENAFLNPLLQRGFKFIANSTKEERNFSQPKFLFISRGKQKTRNIVNYSEVSSFLKGYNFKEVHLEDLGFEEQIHLFNSASVVVAPHGAGLTNLVFANRGTKVIEIVPTERKGSHYFYLSISLGLNYKAIFCSSDENFNLFVDLTVLKLKLLEWEFESNG